MKVPSINGHPRAEIDPFLPFGQILRMSPPHYKEAVLLLPPSNRFAPVYALKNNALHIGRAGLFLFVEARAIMSSTSMHFPTPFNFEFQGDYRNGTAVYQIVVNSLSFLDLVRIEWPLLSRHDCLLSTRLCRTIRGIDRPVTIQH